MTTSYPSYPLLPDERLQVEEAIAERETAAREFFDAGDLMSALVEDEQLKWLRGCLEGNSDDCEAWREANAAMADAEGQPPGTRR